MFTREITVQPSDAGCLGTIKLRSLLNYFQDTAGVAVQDIEGTTAELVARGYAWVLTRYEVEFIGQLPAIDETFTLSTFHDPKHGYNTLRVFQASMNGRPFVWAKTQWLLLDLAAGRPVKAAAHIPEIASKDTQDIPPEFRDIPDYEDIDTVKEVTRTVGFHDLDYNGHVNNAAYFEWVHDATPLEFSKYEVRSICASFRSGAKFGENVRLRIAERPEELTYCYELLRDGVAKPSARFLCTWGAREQGLGIREQEASYA